HTHTHKHRHTHSHRDSIITRCHMRTLTGCTIHRQTPLYVIIIHTHARTHTHTVLCHTFTHIHTHTHCSMSCDNCCFGSRCVFPMQMGLLCWITLVPISRPLEIRSAQL